MIDFPASPANGQVFTSGAQSWTWDGTKWVASGNAVMPPLSTGDNRLINGDMRINQRGVTNSTAINVYTVDRWNFGASVAAKGNWVQNTASASPGFPNYLGFVSASAYAPLAADNFMFYQPIEADMISDFQWGTANAQPVTLSFWAQSTLTGTFGGALKQYGASRAYPFTFTLPTTAWTKIAVTIPGDTGGSWVLGGNAGSLMVVFDLGCGANSRGPANAWASAAYLGATGAVSVVSTNAATFLLTGVKLEIGSVATPFNRQSLAKSMADCQRYYQQRSAAAEGAASIVGPMQAFGTGSVFGLAPFVPMRAAPSVTLSSPAHLACSTAIGGTSAAFSGGSAGGILQGWSINVSGTSGLVAGNAVNLLWSGSLGVLTASAEL